MAAADLLAQLQTTFPQGATSGSFDATQVQGGEYADLLTGLGIATTLEITSPLGWQSDGTDVTLSGALTTPALGLTDAPLLISFTPAGSDWVLLIDLGLPPSWTFADSFALLASSVLSELALDASQQAAFVIASGDATDALRLVDDAGLGVQAGLTFYGLFTAASPGLAMVAWILAQGSLQTTIGPIAYDASSGAVSMQLPLAQAGIAELFGSDGPALEFAVSLYSGLDTVLNQYDVGVRFDAELDFGPDETLDVWALLASGQEPILDLTISGTALAFPSPTVLDQFFGPNNGIAAALPQLDGDNGDTVVQVNAITFGIGLRSQTLEYSFLSVGALDDETWEVWPDVITLGDIGFVFSIFQPLGPYPTWSFRFDAVFTLGASPDEVPILVTGELPAEIITGGLDPTQPPPNLAGLLAQVFTFTTDLPQELEIAELRFSADVAQSVYSADIEILGVWAFDFGDDNEIVLEDLALSVEYDGDGGSGVLSGMFAVDVDNIFRVEFDVTETNTTFKGAWRHTGSPLTFQDIAIALGMYGLPTLPENLDLDLASAELVFESKAPMISFTIQTSSYGAATLVAGKNAAGTDWGFVYGMIVAVDLTTIDLTDIPIVGDLVPVGDDRIELTNLRIVAATTALPDFTPTPAERHIFGGIVNSGLVLSIELQVGSNHPESFSVRFGGTNDGTATDLPPSGSGSGAPAAALPAALPAAPDADSDSAPTSAQAGPQVTWINVQRSFGPVQINRIGFGLTPADDLGLQLDAAVTIEGLSVTLVGLEAEIPLQAPFAPTFSLAGLDVSFSAGGLTIAGGLDKVAGKDAYSGELQLDVDRFGATAIGEYSRGDSGWSLFVFVDLKVPLGGPPVFFVTGLSGGFGYNTSLSLPTIDGVASYPLVVAATNPKQSAKDTITALGTFIAPEQNEDWIAAGINFTSYDMVVSYALLTVAFGPDIEIGLMGEATITVPPSTIDYPMAPVAQAQMQLLVDIAPSSGVVSVCAQLSPSSYVFSTSAKLTGGFAFYVWFDPSPHSGDFVITLGGYNPAFTPPSYYPQVPLLGLNWQICSELTAKGGLYFALTPSVIMAGGSFDATWQSFGLKAWFDAQADFLIRYKPFTFEIDLSIDVGASITVDLLVSVTVKVQAGGTLDIWGPPVGGKVSVDLCIFSVDMSFGASSPPDSGDIGWSEFSQSFLPSPLGAATPAQPDPAPTTTTNSLITISAPSGIVSTFEKSAVTVWSVSAGALILQIATQIPSTAASIAPASTISSTPPWQTQLGVGPMGAAAGSLASTLSVTLQRDGDPDDDDWNVTAVLAAVPAAMWQNTTNAMQTDGTVPDALMGLTLVPAPPSGQSTVPVAIAQLLTDNPPVRTYAWSDATVPQSDPFGADQSQPLAMAQLQTTLVDTGVAATRSAILASLTAQGMTTAAGVDVGAFANEAPDLLASAPSLRYLGEVPVLAGA